MNDEMIPLPRSYSSPPGAPAQQFPLLAESPQVLAVWWHGRPYRQPTAKPARPRTPVRPLPERLVVSLVKGAPLGVLAAAVVYGVWPARQWWLAEWHWAIALGAVLLLRVLVSTNAAVLAAAGIALVQGASLGVHDLVHGGLPVLSVDLREVARVILVTIAVRVAWEILLSPLRARRR